MYTVHATCHMYHAHAHLFEEQLELGRAREEDVVIEQHHVPASCNQHALSVQSGCSRGEEDIVIERYARDAHGL